MSRRINDNSENTKDILYKKDNSLFIIYYFDFSYFNLINFLNIIIVSKQQSIDKKLKQ